MKMLAEFTNFSPPLEIGIWLACACFTLWFLLLVDKGISRVRGKEAHPPNSQLDASQQELDRRITALETWKNGLIEKMEADKTEILSAGERREDAIRSEIKVVSGRMDNLQATISNIPQQFFALLSDAKNVLGHGGSK